MYSQVAVDLSDTYIERCLEKKLRKPFLGTSNAEKTSAASFNVVTN